MDNKFYDRIGELLITIVSEMYKNNHNLVRLFSTASRNTLTT